MWEILNYQHGFESLGYLPQIIHAGGGPVVEQVNQNYRHGGGWNKFTGFVLSRPSMELCYPVKADYEEEEIYKPYARLKVSDSETVYVYDHAWVLIDRGGDDWEVSRMD